MLFRQATARVPYVTKQLLLLTDASHFHQQLESGDGPSAGEEIPS
jgi:hypothetical protein